MFVYLIVALVIKLVSAYVPVSNHHFTPNPPPMSLSMASNDKFSFVKDTFKVALVSAFAGRSLASGARAADYAPSSASPTLSPQVARQSPKAVQAGVPSKWGYSKFQDEVGMNDAEKVAFSRDGKRAVGVDNDGVRFTGDIPNDPMRELKRQRAKRSPWALDLFGRVGNLEEAVGKLEEAVEELSKDMKDMKSDMKDTRRDMNVMFAIQISISLAALYKPYFKEVFRGLLLNTPMTQVGSRRGR